MTQLQRPLPRMSIFDRPYWDFVARGELRLQRCKTCGHLRYPPGPACPQCLSQEYAWTALSGRGRVLAWTVFHRQYFPQLPVPYTVLCVETEEGPMLIGNLVQAGPGELSHGMPVRAVFEQVAAPDDASWWICQWAPIGA